MPAIRILNSSYINWTSGIAGGGKGVDYYFTLLATADYISLDSAFIRDERLKTFCKLKGTNSFSDYREHMYYTNDTIELRASGNNRFRSLSESDTPSDDFIIYFQKGTRYYLPIDTLTEQKNAPWRP